MTLPLATFLLDETLATGETWAEDGLAALVGLGPDRAHGGPGAPASRPPIPTSWRRPCHGQVFQALPGTGQGLFGLRDIPFVNRDANRERIWQGLREAQSLAAVRVVAVTSPAGLGKSHLMRWMAERAHELGVAQTLAAHHSPIAGPSDGLPRMLMNHLHGGGLPRAKLHDRIVQGLRRLACGAFSTEELAEDAASLLELIQPPGPADKEIPGVSRIAIDSPAHRYAIIARYLALCARDRPLMICIDDVQWGLDALGFVHYVLSDPQASHLPLLFVISARSDLLHQRAQEGALFQEIFNYDGAEHIELAPLASGHHRRLIGGLLSLHDDLRAHIAEATGGHPLKAVQLVSHWVNTGRLVPTARGYVLSGGDAGNDDDVDGATMALEAIRQALGGEAAAERAWPCFEAAAAIGVDVDRDEWEYLCRHLGYPVRAAWLTTLATAGIIRMRRGGWSFHLAIYREALELHAREQHRWREIHKGLAEIVDHSTDHTTCHHERRARHLIASDAFEAALEPLWLAIEARTQSSSYRATLDLVELSIDAANRAGLAPADRRRLRLSWRRAETLRFMGRNEEANTEISDLLAIAPSDDDELRGHVFRVMASLRGNAGEVALAVELYRRAREYFDQAQDWSGIARALHGEGWMLINLSRFDEARDCYARGRIAARKAGDERQEAWCVAGIGESLVRQGDPEGEPFCQQAFEAFERLGSRSGMALALANLGSCARRKGDYDLAQTYYDRARGLATQIRHVLSNYTRYLFSLLALQRGDVEEATRQLAPLLSIHERLGANLYVFGNFVLAAAIAATRNDAGTWDLRIEEIDKVVTRPGLVLQMDHVDLLESSRARWDAWGDLGRAHQASRLRDILTARLGMPHP